MTGPTSTRAARAKAARNRLLRQLLVTGQRVGLDITPHHFYSNVPDLRSLAADPGWRAARTMHGVAGADVDEQLGFLTDCLPDDIRAQAADPAVYRDACAANGAVGYGPIEAAVLFAFVARHRPARVVQIGSGVSTAVVLAAAAAVGAATEVVCIDPYPTQYLRERASAGQLRLLDLPAQQVDLAEFTALGPGDLLFVDSTHTVKPGSEVNRIVLEILPRLAKDVFAHFHDVYLPYDYGRDVLSDELFFWNESVLLHALLIDNARMAIRLSCSMLHHARREGLRELFPQYRPQPMSDGLARDGRVDGDFPSALYLQVTA